MRGIVASLPFALLTVLCWGSYGPVLHHGKSGMDSNSWAQLLCVGISYFVVAVIVPWYVLKSKGEQGNWSAGGVKWGLAAGALGAFGALGIITALTQGGSPSYVMPIVFGCAPVVNTFVSMYMTKLFKETTPAFFLGIILVALGACGVFAFKPVAKAKEAVQLQTQITTVSFEQEQTSATDPADEKAPETGTATDTANHNHEAKNTNEKKTNVLLIVGGICLTVLSWGAYGSVLHKSQHLMQGSRLRPLLCVGISYFVLAVIIPILIMYKSGFPEQTTTSGWTFSLLAGVCGSVGALGIILSFTFGGKPVFVMPLVFGGAPIVNTVISVLEMDTIGDVSPFFFVSLSIVIIGAIVTLVSAPKPGKKPKTTENEEQPLWDKAREESAANLAAVKSAYDETNDADDAESGDSESGYEELSEETANADETNDASGTDSDEDGEQEAEATATQDDD